MMDSLGSEYQFSTERTDRRNATKKAGSVL